MTRFIDQVRRRWLMQRLARTLFFAVIAAEVFVVAMSMLHATLLATLAFVFAGGLLVMLWVAWSGRPTELEASKAVDTQFGLDELVGTAVSLNTYSDSTVAELLRGQAAVALSSRSVSSLQFGAPRGRAWFGVGLGALVVLNLQPLTAANLPSHAILPIASAAESAATLTVGSSSIPIQSTQSDSITAAHISDEANEASANEFDTTQAVALARASGGLADAQTNDGKLGRPPATVGDHSDSEAAESAVASFQLLAPNSPSVPSEAGTLGAPQSNDDGRSVLQRLPRAYQSIAQRYFSVNRP